MSEELVKRLREGDEFERFMLAERAADLIEELEAVVGRQHKRAETLTEGWRIADDARIELEAKLAKLEAAAQKAVGHITGYGEASTARIELRTALAELTGGKDE